MSLVPGAPPPPPPRRGCRFGLVALLAVVGGAAAMCCLGGLVLVVALAPQLVPVELKTRRSLGTVLVPPTLGPQQAHVYGWRQGLRRYDVAYGASAEVKDEASARLATLARRLSYRSTGQGEFQWAPPRTCLPEPWECVYRMVGKDNRDNLAGLAAAFEAHRRAEGLDLPRTVELVTAFVQSITYRMPEGRPFGLVPPTVVAAEGWGDCDSKTMLAALLLDELGVDTVVLHSHQLKHAALGVAIPGGGRRFRLGGRHYLYVEVTTSGWPVGTMPPEVDSPRLWTAVPWKR